MTGRHFPPLRSDEIGIEEQQRKVLEECRELRAAYEAGDFRHFLHESYDVIHAIETLQDVVRREIEPCWLWTIRDEVREKVRSRGRYYTGTGDQGPGTGKTL